MRIAFLTGGLEPGRDGVGDYTRTLAQALIERGVSCGIIALADRHADQVVRGETEGLPTLRLPGAMPWRSRARTAAELVRSWGPDWVSLQFVPYSFQRRGLAFGLVHALPGLVERARLQVMFHEVWTLGDGALRQRLVAAGQRRCVLRIARFPHARLHTSNRTYQRLLLDRGVQAGLLPLFGSIPTAAPEDRPWLLGVLEDAGCSGLGARRDEWWIFVLFGTLHPVWPAEPLFGRLQAAARRAGKRIAVVSVGGIGTGARLWDGLCARYGNELSMVRLAEQPAGRIAAALGAADFAIATTPYALLDKSATVAAMLEHGLPVIVNREDGPPVVDEARLLLEPTRLIRLDEDFEHRLMTVDRRPAASRLPMVARQFLADLDTSTTLRGRVPIDAAAQPSHR